MERIEEKVQETVFEVEKKVSEIRAIQEYKNFLTVNFFNFSFLFS